MNKKIVSVVVALVLIGVFILSLTRRSATTISAQQKPEQTDAEMVDTPPTDRPADERKVIAFHPGTQIPWQVQVWRENKAVSTEYLRPDGTLDREESSDQRYSGHFDETGKVYVYRVWRRRDGSLETVVESPIGGKKQRKDFRSDGTLWLLTEFPEQGIEIYTRYRRDGKTIWWTEERPVKDLFSYRSTLKIRLDYHGNNVDWTLERRKTTPDLLSSHRPAREFAVETLKRADGTVFCRRVWHVSFNHVTREFERVCSLYEEFAKDGTTVTRQIRRDTAPSMTGIFPILEDFALEKGSIIRRFYRSDDSLEREFIRDASGRSQLRSFDAKDNVRPELPDLMYDGYGVGFGQENDID